MKQAIDDFKAIPGVVGACFFGTQEGVLQCNLPRIFKPEKLVAVGQQLAKLLAAGRMSLDDMQDLLLHYDESVIIARELRKGLIVFVFCDPTFNHNLLTLSLNLLQDDLRDQQSASAKFSAGQSNAGAGPQADVPPLDSDALAKSQALKLMLTEALGKVMGPMAGIIVDEVFADWSQSEGSPDDLSARVDRIKQEIADPQKITTFEALIKPHLSSWGG